MRWGRRRLAHAISAPRRRINEIVLGTPRSRRHRFAARVLLPHGIRVLGLRLGCFFRMESEFWLNLQSRFDLEVAKNKLAGRLKTGMRPRAA